MVLSPAFTLSFSSSKPSSRQKFNCNLSETPSSPYFLSSIGRNNFNASSSSSNSINLWSDNFVGNNGYPSTSTTFNHSRLRSVENKDLLLKAPRTVSFNSEQLSAERRRFNRISLRESTGCSNNNNRLSLGFNINNDWKEKPNNFDNSIQRRQSLASDFNSIFETSNGAARNRVILERKRTTESRRSFYLNNNENIHASTSTINISNGGGFHLRVGDRSPFTDLSTNTNSTVNNQNLGSTSIIINANSVPVTRSSSTIHTSASILAARKRSAAAFKRLNEPSQRIWVSTDVDKTVHLDDRALSALLRAERTVQPNIEHFKMIQTEITESMRRAVVIRMNEICLRENCDLIVFPLAVSYLDRLLSVQFVPQHNLQALADAALLLAMKMKSPQPPIALNIVDGQQSRLDELFDWELFIVNKLGWGLSTPTPFEFFDQLIVRAPILEHLRDAFAQTLFTMLKDLQLACNLASNQAAACLLYVADESQKRHLICESEGTIRKCFQLDANTCRSCYATNIRFALSDFFFDSEREVVNEKELSPPATKRFVLAEELASSSSSTLSSDEDKLIESSNNDFHPEIKDDKNLASTADLEDETLIAATETSDEIDVKCLENWLFDDEDDENYVTDGSSFDFSFSSSSFDETVSLPNTFTNVEIEQNQTPSLLTNIDCFTKDFQSSDDTKSVFEDVFKVNQTFNVSNNSKSSIKTDLNLCSNKTVSVNTNSNHYVLNDDNNNENSNSSCVTGTSYNSEMSCANFCKNDSGFNSYVSTPEFPLTADQSTTTTTLAPICTLMVPTETSNDKNNFVYCNTNIFKHQGFGQLFEF